MVIDDWFERPGSKVLRIDGRRNRTSPKEIIKDLFFWKKRRKTRDLSLGIKDRWRVRVGDALQSQARRRVSRGSRREKRVLGYTGSICEE